MGRGKSWEMVQQFNIGIMRIGRAGRAKTAEPIELLFGMVSRVSCLRNRVLDGVHIGWQIRLNDCSRRLTETVTSNGATRPLPKLLWHIYQWTPSSSI